MFFCNLFIIFYIFKLYYMFLHSFTECFCYPDKLQFAKVLYSSEKLHKMIMEIDMKPLKGHADGIIMRWEEKIFQCFCILSQTFCMCSPANSFTYHFFLYECCFICYIKKLWLEGNLYYNVFVSKLKVSQCVTILFACE